MTARLVSPCRNFFSRRNENLQDGSFELRFHIKNGFVCFDIEQNVAFLDDIAAHGN